MIKNGVLVWLGDMIIHQYKSRPEKEKMFIKRNKYFFKYQSGFINWDALCTSITYFLVSGAQILVTQGLIINVKFKLAQLKFEFLKLRNKISSLVTYLNY